MKNNLQCKWNQTNSNDSNICKSAIKINDSTFNSKNEDKPFDKRHYIGLTFSKCRWKALSLLCEKSSFGGYDLSACRFRQNSDWISHQKEETAGHSEIYSQNLPGSSKCDIVQYLG